MEKPDTFEAQSLGNSTKFQGLTKLQNPPASYTAGFFLESMPSYVIMHHVQGISNLEATSLSMCFHESPAALSVIEDFAVQ